MKALIVLVAYLVGIASLLPSLVVVAVTASVTWVGVRFIFQVIQILMS